MKAFVAIAASSLTAIAFSQLQYSDGAIRSGQISFEFQTINTNENGKISGKPQEIAAELIYLGQKYHYKCSKIWTYPYSKRVSFFSKGDWLGTCYELKDGTVEVLFKKASPPFFAEKLFFSLWPGPSLILRPLILNRSSLPALIDEQPDPD